MRPTVIPRMSREKHDSATFFEAWHSNVWYKEESTMVAYKWKINDSGVKTKVVDLFNKYNFNLAFWSNQNIIPDSRWAKWAVQESLSL